MFFRRKISGRTEYLQIVKNERIEGKPRQSVVATLGRIDELAQDGTLDRLLRSGARFAPAWCSSLPTQSQTIPQSLECFGGRRRGEPGRTLQQPG